MRYIVIMSLLMNIVSSVEGVSSGQGGLSGQGIYLHGESGRPAAVLTSVMEFIEAPITYKQMMIALNETKLDTLFQKTDLIGSNFTLFLPTDSTFDQFGRLGLLRSPSNVAPDPERQKKYEQFVKYHIVKNMISCKELINMSRPLQTEAGTPLLPSDIGEILFSVELKGSIVHVIKKVLISPDLKDYLYPKSAP